MNAVSAMIDWAGIDPNAAKLALVAAALLAQFARLSP